MHTESAKVDTSIRMRMSYDVQSTHTSNNGVSCSDLASKIGIPARNHSCHGPARAHASTQTHIGKPLSHAPTTSTVCSHLLLTKIPRVSLSSAFARCRSPAMPPCLNEGSNQQHLRALSLTHTHTHTHAHAHTHTHTHIHTHTTRTHSHTHSCVCRPTAI